MLKIIMTSFFFLSCSYKLGFSKRQLPEGFTRISIPIFENKTHENGVEVFFTNALIQQFALSKVVEVVSRENSAVVLEGVIEDIRVSAESQARRTTGSNSDDTPVPDLPENTVLTTKYRIYALTSLTLRRKSDDQIIWRSTFAGEQNYSAPLLETVGINSANALYNSSARIQNIETMAKTMMVEAHDRVTENF